MNLYTFLMEYLGGTYISQVNAGNLEVAMRDWLKNLKVEEIKNFSERDRETLLKNNFEDEEPILISSTKNVWHFMISTKKGSGYVNVVKTGKR